MRTNNSLADEEKSFIVPLMIIGAVLVIALLLVGIFMPNVSWSM